MFILWLIILPTLANALVNDYRQVYQPVDVGFQFSTPVNLANTLQNSVAGPVSVALVVAFTAILFAGLFFPKFSSSWNARSEDTSSSWYRLLEPVYADEAFEFMEDLGDPCRRKILCHIHSFVPYAPAWLQIIVRSVSRNIRGMARYKEDIVHGLGGGDCHARYKTDCPQSVSQLLMMTRPIRRLLEQQGRHFRSTGPKYFNF